MKGDQERQVGNFITLIRGTTYKGELVGKPGPALLGLGSIEPGGGFRVGNYKTYGGDCPEKLMLAPGDLYVSLKGATKDGEMIGSVARVPPEVTSGRLTQDTVKLQFTCETEYYRDYLYWLLRTPQYRAYCAGHATGSAVVALSRKDFLSYPVPPLNPSRRSLIAVLEQFERKIELNRRMNETLESMARAIFRDWFVDFGPTRAKQEQREPYLASEIWSLFPDRLDADGKPEGWKRRTLGNLEKTFGGEIRTGPFGSQLHQSDYVPSGTPVVMPANLTLGAIIEDGIARIDADTLARLSDHQLRAGDVIYGRRGDIGRKALVGPDEEGWLCGTGCLRIRIISAQCPPLFLFYHLDQPEIREWIATRAVGATMPNLNTSILREVEILLPEDQLCGEFVELSKPLDDRGRAARSENKHLASLRDFLLPKVMSGEIHVRDAEAVIQELA